MYLVFHVHFWLPFLQRTGLNSSLLASFSLTRRRCGLEKCAPCSILQISRGSWSCRSKCSYSSPNQRFDSPTTNFTSTSPNHQGWGSRRNGKRFAARKKSEEWYPSVFCQNDNRVIQQICVGPLFVNNNENIHWSKKLKFQIKVTYIECGNPNMWVK